MALSALVQYHNGLGPFDACALDFGHSFPGAPPPPNAIVAACGLNSTAAGHLTASTVQLQVNEGV